MHQSVKRAGRKRCHLVRGVRTAACLRPLPDFNKLVCNAFVMSSRWSGLRTPTRQKKRETQSTAHERKKRPTQVQSGDGTKRAKTQSTEDQRAKTSTTQVQTEHGTKRARNAHSCCCCCWSQLLCECYTEVGWRAASLARSESDGQPHKLTPEALCEFESLSLETSFHHHTNDKIWDPSQQLLKQTGAQKLCWPELLWPVQQGSLC